MEAVARQPGDADGGVVWPDRAVVVAHRVVGGHRRGKGANPPAAEELRGDQVLGDLRGMFDIDDAGPEQVADVGGDRVDLTFRTVERQRETAGPGQEETLVERPLQQPRLLVASIRSLVVAEMGSDFGT